MLLYRPPITSKSPPGGGKIKSAHHRSHTSTVKSTPVTTNKVTFILFY